MNEADDAFDVITLIMTLAIFVPIMVMCAIPLFQGDVGGFDVLIEKSAPPTESEIVLQSPEFTTRDALLMLVVADQHTPEPKRMRLNVAGSPVEIALNDAFFVNRLALLQQAHAAMPNQVDVKLQLYAGPSGMRFWEVQPDVQP